MNETGVFYVTSFNRSSVNPITSTRLFMGSSILSVIKIFCKRFYPLIFNEIRYSQIFNKTHVTGYIAYVMSMADPPEMIPVASIEEALPIWPTTSYKKV